MGTLRNGTTEFQGSDVWMCGAAPSSPFTSPVSSAEGSSFHHLDPSRDTLRGAVGSPTLIHSTASQPHEISVTSFDVASGIWYLTPFEVGTRVVGGLLEQGGLRGTAGAGAGGGSGDGVLRATVARWVADLLRVPWQSVVSLVRFEHGSRFHLRISLHPLRAALATAEVLAADDEADADGGREQVAQGTGEPWQPAHERRGGDGGGGGVREQSPEDFWLLSLGGETPSATLAMAEAAAGRAMSAVEDLESAGNRLAELLEERVEQARARIRVAEPGDARGGSGGAGVGDGDGDTIRLRRRWHRVAAAVESVRPEKGCIRLRLAPRLIVAAALLAAENSPTTTIYDPNAPFTSTTSTTTRTTATASSTSTTATPSTSTPTAVTAVTAGTVVVRAPQPRTPWSCLRAQLVGAALHALHDVDADAAHAGTGRDQRAPPPPPRVRAWGLAVRAVLVAAQGGTGMADTNGGGVEEFAAEGRAGNAWPALVREPGSGGRGAECRSGSGWQSAGSLVVGGCKCMAGSSTCPLLISY